MLVFSRIVQAMGAAAASAMSLALAKDLYDGEGRKKLLAYLGVIVPLCPMVAPTIGAFMLSHVSWRGIFLSQAILSLTALYGAFRLTEPLQEKGSGGFSAAVGRYRDLLRNKAYLGYAISFSLLGFPFFAYIASSADIFITGFGMTEQTYGLYFAFNAFALMIGSFLCSRLCVGIASRTILLVSVTGMICSAAAMLYLGGDTPVLFALPMFAYSMFLGMSRPISNHMILEQVQKDAGTASSLLTFFFFICGAIAMETISFNWESKPLAIAIMGLAATITPLIVVIKIRDRA
jgi:DHA1 family bicyclomycin/chloramphenicol resistance-like MFS transporter